MPAIARAGIGVGAAECWSATATTSPFARGAIVIDTVMPPLATATLRWRDSSTPPSVRSGRRGGCVLREIDREGAVVAVEDHRAERAGAASPIGAESVALLVERHAASSIRDARRADRLERGGEIEHALAVDRIDPRRAGVARGAIEQVDDLRAGEVGEGLGEQRHRAR